LGKTRVVKILIIFFDIKKLNILIYREGAAQCGFLIIKLQTALHYVMRLCHFVGNFGAIFAVW